METEEIQKKEETQKVVSENPAPSKSETVVEQTEPVVEPTVPVTPSDVNTVLLSEISVQLDEMLAKFDKEEKEYKTHFSTPSGQIAVVHEITLGNLILSTLLVVVFIFLVLKDLVRRF